MVSLEDSFSGGINSLINGLAGVIGEINRPGDLSGLMARHFLADTHTSLQFDWKVSVPLMDWLDQHSSDFFESPSLATLGFLIFDLVHKKTSPLVGALTAFKRGLDLLRDRQNVFTTPNSWAIQPDIVLGITLGVSVLDDPIFREWMREKLYEGLEHPELPLFLRLVYRYGLYLLKAEPLTGDSHFFLNLDSLTCTLPELALFIWLVRHGVFVPDTIDSAAWLDKTQAELLERCVVEDPQSIRDEKAAVVLEALLSYINTRSRYPRVDLVISLLSNFEATMERWNRSWRIRDEYDIQSLLWLILRSSFDDLRYEEYFPKFGRSGYRYDLGIPQLSLVIEAKYARAKNDFQRIVDEIGKDSAQLSTQAKFTGIIVFLYDQSCSVEQYAWVQDAIEQIRFVKKCIICSAPSTTRSVENLQTQSPKTSARRAKHSTRRK